jgi:nucleotide-binding universal stress UspA family protein
MPTAPETFWDQEKDIYFKEKMKTNYHEWQKSTQKAAQLFLDDAKNILVNAGVAANEVGTIIQKRKVGIARDIVAESTRGYDAVVVGRRGWSKLADLFLGSVSNKVAEGIRDVTVWVVGRDIRSDRMLVAVDASKNSRKAVDYAGTFASGAEVELTLFHVVRKLGFEFMDGVNLRDEEIDGFMEQVERDTRRMLTSYKNSLEKAGVAPEKISTKRTLGSYTRAGDILTEAQDGGYGTIVMGRRGLSKVHEFIMGRVTNKVLHRAQGFAVWIVP